MTINSERWQVIRVMETVLLLDADDAIRQALKIVLELNGYRVVEALTGIEALQILGEWSEDIQVAVCADELPDMTAGQWRGQVRFLGLDIPSLILAEKERKDIADMPIGNSYTGTNPKPFAFGLTAALPQATTRLLEKVRLALDERFFLARLRATAA